MMNKRSRGLIGIFWFGPAGVLRFDDQATQEIKQNVLDSYVLVTVVLVCMRVASG